VTPRLPNCGHCSGAQTNQGIIYVLQLLEVIDWSPNET